MSIETLFKITQKQAKINEFVENLKKNPKQVSEYKKLVLNGGLEAKETASMIADIPKLKEKGYIIDGISVGFYRSSIKPAVNVFKRHKKDLKNIQLPDDARKYLN